MKEHTTKKESSDFISTLFFNKYSKDEIVETREEGNAVI